MSWSGRWRCVRPGASCRPGAAPTRRGLTLRDAHLDGDGERAEVAAVRAETQRADQTQTGRGSPIPPARPGLEAAGRSGADSDVVLKVSPQRVSPLVKS